MCCKSARAGLQTSARLALSELARRILRRARKALAYTHFDDHGTVTIGRYHNSGTLYSVYLSVSMPTEISKKGVAVC